MEGAVNPYGDIYEPGYSIHLKTDSAARTGLKGDAATKNGRIFSKSIEPAGGSR